MIDRRAFLLSSAALGACATAAPPAPANDSAFRTQVDQLAAATPQERAAALRAIDPRTLTGESRVLYKSIAPGAESEAALAAMPYGADGRLYAITHRTGAYRRIATELGGDGQALASAIDAETTRLEADAARGVAPPAFILDRTLAALEAAREPLTRARSAAAVAIGGAHARQVEAVQRLRANARSTTGLAALPNGDAYYRHALQVQLGARVSLREAHALAEEQCRQFGALAFRTMTASGVEFPRSRFDIGPQLTRFAADPEFLYSDDAAGKARAVADMNATLAELRRTVLPRAFNGAENLRGEIRGLTAEEEAGGVQGRREGDAYIVDLRRIRTRPVWTLPTVAAHETLPGHLLQTQFQAAPSPRLQTRFAGGFSEGWATYAEQLADDLGFYEGKPRDRLGYAHWMLFRWGRVLVDTGIHALGWSRDHAIAEWRRRQGFDVGFVSIEDDVDRMCVEPAAFAAQGLAAHDITAKRVAAQQRYGAAFSLPRFHDAVLRRGPLSPPGLEEAIRVAFES